VAATAVGGLCCAAPKFPEGLLIPLGAAWKGGPSLAESKGGANDAPQVEHRQQRVQALRPPRPPAAGLRR